MCYGAKLPAFLWSEVKRATPDDAVRICFGLCWCVKFEVTCALMVELSLQCG